MTTYAPNFTPRYRVKYRVGGIDHTIQIRNARGATFSGTESDGLSIGTLVALFNAVLMDDFAFGSAELALTDSDVFLPCASPADPAGALDPGTFGQRERIRGLTFNGKATGSRARFTLFGVMLDDTGTGAVGADGIVLPAELAAIASAATLASSNYRAGSGDAAIFPARATYKENDHLLKLVRKGTIS